MSNLPSEFFDISIVLGTGCPCYPSDTPFKREVVSDFAQGDPYHLSRIAGSGHSGTHLDAPAHFIPGGKTLDLYPVSRFLVRAMVVEAQGEAVEASDVNDLALGDCQAVLFKTRNSRDGLLERAEFASDYVYITAAAASALVKKGVGLVGLDYLSVDAYGVTDYGAHLALLGNDVLVLEGVNLRQVAPGVYTLACFPLRIAGAEGSPVRAIVFR